MSAARRFGRFWWDFVVGEDWRIAVAIVAALAVTAGLAAADIPVWWLMPAAVAAVLWISLRRAAR